MSVVTSIRSQLVPIHPEGYPFIGGFALASLILFWIWSPLGWIGTMLTLWCCYFFRDPRARDAGARRPRGLARRRPRQPDHQCGAAERARARRPAAAARLGLHERVRLPCEPRARSPGRIERIVYRARQFLNADLDKASEDNERNGMVIATAGGAHRRGADRGAGRAAHRLLRARRASRSAPASASA